MGSGAQPIVRSKITRFSAGEIQVRTRTYPCTSNANFEEVGIRWYRLCVQNSSKVAEHVGNITRIGRPHNELSESPALVNK
jgi:hypothetical protein